MKLIKGCEQYGRIKGRIFFFFDEKNKREMIYNIYSSSNLANKQPLNN